jgi:hypothetical protein
VRDSDVVFAVQQVVCDVRRIGSYRTPVGQMCLVDVVIRNDGRRSHWLPNQRLYTTDGREFGSNAFLAPALGQGPIQWTTIGQGQTLSGTLVFELPARARPEELDFRADLLNSGSRRDLR